MGEHLKKLAASVGEVTSIVHGKVALAAAGEVGEQNIFSYELATTLPVNDITLSKAAYKEEELSLICTEITKQVRRCGLRYRDIALVMADAAAYRQKAKAVFKRYGIPYFTDDRQILSVEPLAFALLGFVRMQVEKFSLLSVCEYLKSPFSGVSYQKAEIFENYCLKYSVNYSYNRPFNLTLSGAEQERQSVADEVRAVADRIKTLGDEAFDVLIPPRNSARR